MRTGEISLVRVTKTHANGKTEGYYINPVTGNKIVQKCPECGSTDIEKNLTCRGCGYEYFIWDWEEEEEGIG